jgi:hypothetical protein
MTEDPDLISREEVLAGLPARRARTLVYLIERAAVRHRADREVGTMALLGERAAEDRELAWIEAFAVGDESSHRPTVQELEAAAEGWAPLVAGTPQIRAATAGLLAERYRLDRCRVPGIRAALGLDTDEVATAFERQTGRPLDSIWSRTKLLERLRWLATAPGRWLEETSPFRAAAALTFLLSMGQTVVIVPIAVAAVGPIAAAGSILVVGLLALSATAAVAEATTRNGEVRFRGAFFGRLVTSTLGTRAGTVPALLGIAGVVLPTLSAFVGLALLLAIAIPIPAELWAVAVGAIAVAIPLRSRRTASFGGLLAFGLLSVALLAGLSALVLAAAAIDGELAAPPLSPPGGIGIDVALGLIIGVLLGSYADPVYTVQIGRIVLPRDPDGSGYVWGSVAGMAAFVAVTALFSAALLFALPAADLAGTDGSALDTVGDRFGAPAIVLASLIGIGLFGIRLYGNAIALFDFVAERLPGRVVPRVVLRARQGRALLSRRGEDRPDISLAYKGIRDRRPRIEVAGGSRRAGEVRDLPGPGESTTIPVDDEVIEVDVLEADEAALRLGIRTELPISYDGDPRAAGPGVAESLLGDDEASRLSAWLLREGGGSVGEAAERFGWSEREARRRLEDLVAAGGAAVGEGQRYVPRMAARRGRSGLGGEVWSRLGVDPPQDPVPESRAGWASMLARVASSPTRRAIVASLPTAALAALAAALIAAGTASVAGPIRIVGVIAFATISGVLPPMLLLAARRRSDVAGAGHGGILVGRVLMALLAASALAALVLHATILWTNPIERGLAAAAAAFAFAAVVFATRHGAFRRSALLELRQSRADGPVQVRAEEGGTPLDAEISLGGRELDLAGELWLEQVWEGLTVHGHASQAEELRISAQQLEPSGTARALPVTAELEEGARPAPPAGGKPGPVRLDERGGSTTFPAEREWTLVVRSEEPEPPQEGGGEPGESGPPPGPRGRPRARKGSPLDQL